MNNLTLKIWDKWKLCIEDGFDAAVLNAMEECFSIKSDMIQQLIEKWKLKRSVINSIIIKAETTEEVFRELAVERFIKDFLSDLKALQQPKPVTSEEVKCKYCNGKGRFADQPIEVGNRDHICVECDGTGNQPKPVEQSQGKRQIDVFAEALDIIFEQGEPTKAVLYDAFHKAVPNSLNQVDLDELRNILNRFSDEIADLDKDSQQTLILKQLWNQLSNLITENESNLQPKPVPSEEGKGKMIIDKEFYNELLRLSNMQKT